jgi:hypothetical protein
MKLEREDNEYYLVDEHYDTIASTDAVMLKACEDVKKLSKQNCDEIFGVVDVEKLADDSSQEFLIKPIESPIFTFGYEEGFEKAMELNKDKLFTIEDIANTINKAREGIVITRISEWETEKEFEYTESEIIQSLQQPTEIEVEIEMDDIWDGIDSARIFPKEETMIPKLDENGCLILKKKS